MTELSLRGKIKVSSICLILNISKMRGKHKGKFYIFNFEHFKNEGLGSHLKIVD